MHQTNERDRPLLGERVVLAEDDASLPGTWNSTSTDERAVADCLSAVRHCCCAAFCGGCLYGERHVLREQFDTAEVLLCAGPKYEWLPVESGASAESGASSTAGSSDGDHTPVKGSAARYVLVRSVVGSASHYSGLLPRHLFWLEHAWYRQLSMTVHSTGIC